MSTPEQAQDAVRDRGDHRDHRARTRRLKACNGRATRRATPRRGRSRRTSARSRRRSAARTRSPGRRRSRRSPPRRRGSSLAERVLEELGERRLGERADRDRGHRDPDLDGRDVLVDVVELRRAPSPEPFWPSSRITSRRARRERTSAYSAITKNALIPTRRPRGSASGRSRRAASHRTPKRTPPRFARHASCRWPPGDPTSRKFFVVGHRVPAAQR